MQADVIVIGAGLAGLAATCEALQRGRSVILVDQEGEQSLGGQAFWSFGGLFLVDSPEQRRLGIRDSYQLALQDWLGTAAFDRPQEDTWPRRWAEAYVHFAAGEKRAWLHERGVRWFPIVGWAERGGYTANGHGNSVPRFHITWGTGPGLVAPFAARAREAARTGRLTFAFRHRVDGLTVTDGVVDGVRGSVLEPSDVPRSAPSSRTVVGEFELHAPTVLVTSGGIGGNFDLVRANWPARMGTPPKRMIAGVPDFVDGRMIAITEAAEMHAATWSPFQIASPGTSSPSTGNPSVSTYDGRTASLARARRSASMLATCIPSRSHSPGSTTTTDQASARRRTWS